MMEGDPENCNGKMFLNSDASSLPMEAAAPSPPEVSCALLKEPVMASPETVASHTLLSPLTAPVLVTQPVAEKAPINCVECSLR